MTRNNLEQHLSWLLSARPSIPPTTSHFNGLAASRAGISGEPIDSSGATSPSPERTDAQSTPKSQRLDEMVRERIAPGSASKRMEILDPRVPKTSSSGPLCVSNPSLAQNPRPAVDERALGPPTPSKKPQASVVPDDIEIMDMTEIIGNGERLQLERAPQPRSGRKRKSDELDPDVYKNSHSARRLATQDHGDGKTSQYFAAIDELSDWQESPEKGGNFPTDPPPPYSTVPPRHQQPNGSQGNSRKKGLSPVPEFSNKHIRDSVDSDDGDNIVNFTARRKPPNQIFNETSFASLTTGDNILPKDERHIANSSPSIAHDTKALDPIEHQQTVAWPSLTSTQEVTSEDAALLKDIFGAPEDMVNNVRGKLESRRDRICEEVADRMDQDLDASHLEKELDDIDSKKSAIASLWTKRSLYRNLFSERERLKDALVQAVKSRHGVDAAKAANAAGKAKLQEIEAECIQLLKVCGGEMAVLLPSTGRRGHRCTPPNPDVRSTQLASKEHDNNVFAFTSSSRVCQTQYHTSTPLAWSKQGQDGASDSDHEPKFTSQRAAESRHRSPMRQDNRLAYTNRDKDFHKPDPVSANQQSYKQRIRTPPVHYGEEEDFGVENDDEMLEFAEDLESHGGRAKPPYNPHRPVFAETSGNSPGRYHATSTKKAKRPAEPAVDMEMHFKFAWSNDVKKALKEKFKLKGFRQGQVEAINATLAGKDAFVLMPTGGGKSLCYQLPSLVRSGKTRGVTLVVSPLMSLMEDQVQHLRDLNIQAFLFNSETSKEERNTLLDGLRDPHVEKFIQVLYVTPELLSANQRMLNALDALYRNQRMARLVIDEAHCVSQWGHDFRPDYKSLGEIRRKFPGVPVMALTATATENVKVDTIHNLGMDGCEVFSRSFNRPNLYYEIRSKSKAKELLENIASIIKEKHPKQTGIVYCLSRQNCEDMAKALRQEHRVKAQHYHAGMEPAEKADVQRKWQQGLYHVIVATIAFGMGIDKANVRFVIHHSLPKSLEGYYQETGRAGRDGQRSDCYLFYGYQDATKLRRMIDQGEGSNEQKDRQHQMLRKMIQFSENRSDCRRVQILGYFNETFDQADCEALCDNCNSLSTFDTVDFTSYAQQVIRLVRQLEKSNVTILHAIEVFRGAGAKKIRERGDDDLDGFGAGRDLDRGDVERLFYRLVSERALAEDNVFNGKSRFAKQYVRLGPNHREFESGRRSLEMQIRSSPKSKVTKVANKREKAKTATNQIGRGKSEGTVRSFAGPDMPLSTNVSSPIQAASIRKKGAQQSRRGDLDASGYRRDGFVVSDPDDNSFKDDAAESDSDGFEPVRVANQQDKRPGARPLGPPITSDAQMDRLDPIHRMVVEQFVAEAQEVCKRLMNEKNLSLAPFSNTILRQMAISFTDTPDEMLTIPGIERERVRLYGMRFCTLVKQYHQNYMEMMAKSEETTTDKHAQNVIDLISDDEGDEFGSLPSCDEQGLGGENEDEAAGQHLFLPPDDDDDNDDDDDDDDRDVAGFNANFKRSQSTGLRTMPAATTSKNRLGPKRAGVKKRTYKARGSASTQPNRRSAGSTSATSRRGSVNFNDFRFDGGGAGSKPASKGKQKRFPPRAGGASRGTAGASKAGGASISMMPT